jgi:hypothetical protein
MELAIAFLSSLDMAGISISVLAEASIWAGTSEAAQNEIFNITNGDYFRWQHMWPRIAKMFDMEVADPVPIPLSVYMADKGPLWDAIVHKDNLQAIPYDQIAAWAFGDSSSTANSTILPAPSRRVAQASTTASTRGRCSEHSSKVYARRA